MLTAPEAAGIPAVMACEFQIILTDAAKIRATMHLLYKIYRNGLNEALLYKDFQWRGEEFPKGGSS